MKLDLACGRFCKPGFIGVDQVALPGVEIVCDLTFFPWNFCGKTDARFTGWAEDNSVDETYCSHFVEHVTDLCGFMDELYRVLKPGATAYLVHPYQHNNRAWQDPTHVRALNEDSWFYFDAEWRAKMGLDYYPLSCDFEVVKVDYALSPEFAHMADDPKVTEFARTRVNVVDDLHVILRARKDADSSGADITDRPDVLGGPMAPDGKATT